MVKMKHVKMVLTGDGGDEPFGGYSFRYLPHLFEEKIKQHIPANLLVPVARFFAKHWPTDSRLPRYLRLSTIFRNLSVDPVVSFFLTVSSTALSIASTVSGMVSFIALVLGYLVEKERQKL